MSSIFAYYRPREVKGNFIIAIVFHLQATETVTVNVSRQRGTNCGRCGVQTPRIEYNQANPQRQMDEGQGEHWELYRIEQIIAGDTITVQIKDRNVIPIQEIVYTPFMRKIKVSDSNTIIRRDGISAKRKPFRMNDLDFGIISFNHIELVDWDNTKTVSCSQEDVNRAHHLLFWSAPEIAAERQELIEQQSSDHGNSSLNGRYTHEHNL